METVPEAMQNNPQFLRYFATWRENEASIVFVPMAEILRDAGYLEEACQVCEKSLEHHPDSISGRLLLASLYWGLQRRADADRLAREILERMPEHPEAIRYLKNGLKRPLRASDPLHTATMAEIMVKQGAFGDAVQVLRSLLKEDPTNRDIRHRLAEVEEMLSGEEKTVT